MLEGAARELAGLGQSAEPQMGEGIERRPDDGAAAMEMQLGHGFAGLGVRRRKPDDQALVEDLARRRIVEAAQDHASGRRQGSPRELLHRVTRPRAAHADDRERAGVRTRRRRRTQRVDRGVGHVRLAAGGAGRGAGAAGTGRAITLSEIFS